MNKNRYGSLRKYKRFLRTRGDFHNPSEQALEGHLGQLGINFDRTGYPDYLILDAAGEIIGFAEVKPSAKSHLKPSQERFKRFCDRLGIPFVKWTPDEPNTLPFTQEPLDDTVAHP